MQNDSRRLTCHVVALTSHIDSLLTGVHVQLRAEVDVDCDPAPERLPALHQGRLRNCAQKVSVRCAVCSLLDLNICIQYCWPLPFSLQVACTVDTLYCKIGCQCHCFTPSRYVLPQVQLDHGSGWERGALHVRGPGHDGAQRDRADGV